MDPTLSVIVLTHNAFSTKGGCIRHTLSALQHQSGCRFEVVVVDNGSDPGDRRKLKRACRESRLSHFDVRVIDADLSIGEARNLGGREARSLTLVFLDDDAILVDRHALEQIASLALSCSHGYGAERLWTPAHPWFLRHQRQLLRALRCGDLHHLTHVSGRPSVTNPEQAIFFERSYIGHCGFVRKYDFEAVGGFPGEFVGYGCEDDALGALLFLREPTFGWLGALRVVHVDHPTPKRYDDEHSHNLQIYGAFLERLGLDAFHIEFLLRGDLLAPKSKIFTPRERA